MTLQQPIPTVESSPFFTQRQSIEFVKKVFRLEPNFDERALLLCIATDTASGEVLMLDWITPSATSVF